MFAKPMLGRTTADVGGDVVVLQLGELARDSDRGLLGRVFHHKVWGIISRKERAGKTCGHVGIWREAYVVPEGSYESVYTDMPAFGLAAAHGKVPVERRGRKAKDRFAYRSVAGVAEEAG